MKQNVDNNILDYQDFLILAYFKANYKKYKFNEKIKLYVVEVRLNGY